MENKRCAIVTGGSRGIGKAICKRLASDGINIMFNYNSNEEEAKKVIQVCESYGVKAYAIKADVSKASECEKLVETAMEHFDGKVDILINNAGITRDNLIVRMSDEDFEDVIDVNLKGAFYMMRAAAKIMLKQKSGKIVNISSVIGVMGNAGQTNYAASKAGIIGMTKSLAKELAGRKINVNAVAPGMIRTDMTDVLSDKAKENIKQAIPFKEMGEADDIANVVSFLVSNDSCYITGQTICVDGGMCI